MYTKGPWTIEVPCGFPYSGLYIVPVVRKDFPFYVAKIRLLREIEESEANARLIAASPRLLDACKAAKEKVNAMQGEWSAVQEAYAPEWTHGLKELESIFEAAIEAAEKG